MNRLFELSPRLPFRVDPVVGESPRGYLCRIAQAYAYDGPLSLAQIAGLPTSGLESDERADQIARVLRLEPGEWRRMCYRHIPGRKRFQERLFLDQRISADDLNYRRPRICSACLKEQQIWWAIWDLGLVTACPKHGCRLLGQCPSCQRRLNWQRPALHKCRCGLDLREVNLKAAEYDLVAINAAIYRAAGVPTNDSAALDLNACGFPAEMLGLKLGSLLRLILFIGATQEQCRLRRKQQPFCSTNLKLAEEIDQAAYVTLRDWPRPLREILRSMLPHETSDPSALNFSTIFGNFYRHLFRVLPRNEFGFLHDAFERFVIEDWKGLIRGQHRYFSPAVRRNAYWITASQAERIARVAGGAITELIQKGQLESITVDVRRGDSHKECWIRRDSLNRWVAARDAELARYMPRSEAVRELGLTLATIVSVAAAGLLRYVKGPERNFPRGCFFFLREDVERVKRAFEKYTAPAMKYSRPGELIALHHAMKNYLGHDSGLAAVIGAVVDGTLTPVGHTQRFRGITGYLFLATQMRKYRPVPGVRVPADGFVNYGEAAAILGITVRDVRGLVAHRILHDAAEYRFGLSKLLATTDVQRFAQNYVALSALAKRFHLNSRSLTRYLREAETAMLAVPLPDARRGHAFFLSKDLAAHIQIPHRRMLEEAGQRRSKAAQKQRWADYRKAKEAALGRPLRRVRANSSL